MLYGSCGDTSWESADQLILSKLEAVKDQGTWCPTCAGNKPLELEIAGSIARSHGGECLSKEYKNNSTALSWRCAEGHEWSAALSCVKNLGSWCPTCASKKSEREVCQTFGAKAPASGRYGSSTWT